MFERAWIGSRWKLVLERQVEGGKSWVVISTALYTFPGQLQNLKILTKFSRFTLCVQASPGRTVLSVPGRHDGAALTY